MKSRSILVAVPSREVTRTTICALVALTLITLPKVVTASSETPTLEVQLLEHIKIEGGEALETGPDALPGTVPEVQVQAERARIKIHSTHLEGVRHQWIELLLPIKISPTDQLMVGDYRYARAGEQVLMMPNEAGEVLLKLPILYSSESFILRRILATGQNGKSSKIKIQIKEWHVLQEKLANQAQKHWNYSVGLGLTQARYTQNTTQVLEWLTTVKGMVLFRPDNPNVDAALSFFYTPLGLYYSDSTRTIQFLGVNFRVGAKMPWLEHPWKLTIMTGAYFATTQSNRVFGYGAVMGPQIFPVLTRQLETSAVSFYAKLSPISANFSVLSLSNREVAWGVNWVATSGALAPFGMYFDAAELSLSLPSGTASNKTLGIGISYNF